MMGILYEHRNDDNLSNQNDLITAVAVSGCSWTLGSWQEADDEEALRL